MIRYRAIAITNFLHSWPWHFLSSLTFSFIVANCCDKQQHSGLELVLFKKCIAFDTIVLVSLYGTCTWQKDPASVKSQQLVKTTYCFIYHILLTVPIRQLLLTAIVAVLKWIWAELIVLLFIVHAWAVSCK